MYWQCVGCLFLEHYTFLPGAAALYLFAEYVWGGGLFCRGRQLCHAGRLWPLWPLVAGPDFCTGHRLAGDWRGRSLSCAVSLKTQRYCWQSLLLAKLWEISEFLEIYCSFSVTIPPPTIPCFLPLFTRRPPISCLFNSRSLTFVLGIVRMWDIEFVHIIHGLCKSTIQGLWCWTPSLLPNAHDKM